jgi:hypothetical protein
MPEPKRGTGRNGAGTATRPLGQETVPAAEGEGSLEAHRSRASPVHEAGKIIGRFCAHSKEAGKYKKEDRRKLERLMLGQALLPLFHAAECEERKFVSDLTRKIAESKNSRTLVQTVVHEIARFYEFTKRVDLQD